MVQAEWFSCLIKIIFFNFNFLKIFLMFYLFLRQRETEHEQGRGREREGDTDSEAGSRLQAICTEPDAGPELTTVSEIMTWAEVGCPTN